MSQFEVFSGWKCLACGAVLRTQKGKEQHMKHCKYIVHILEGQVKFQDFVKQNTSIHEK